MVAGAKGHALPLHIGTGITIGKQGVVVTSASTHHAYLRTAPRDVPAILSGLGAPGSAYHVSLHSLLPPVFSSQCYGTSPPEV